jgi:hypothetical protein
MQTPHQQPEPPAIDDEYIRRKIEEAYSDIEQNGIQPLDMAAIKQELRRRLTTSSDT